MHIDSPMIQWIIYALIGAGILVLFAVGMLVFRVLPRLKRIITELKRLSEDTNR
jgi:exosortase/archaeosortase